MVWSEKDIIALWTGANLTKLGLAPTTDAIFKKMSSFYAIVKYLMVILFISGELWSALVKKTCDLPLVCEFPELDYI